jgi:TM2 domain-containing membrane protein YozV
MSTDAKVVGYCRACGKALDETTVRNAHGTIYCAEHVPAEPKPAAEPPSPYTTAPPPPPPSPNAEVSPGLAFLLGMIPGVGAIYNGQYAKGLVHVVILGLMITILNSGATGGVEPLIGLMLSAFWFYMAFEAYHTAKKRRMGHPVDEFSSLVPMRGGSRFPVAPVLLITLGVLFLLHNLDILELRRVIRYWPVALIALGVYMLYIRVTGAEEANHERR